MLKNMIVITSLISVAFVATAKPSPYQEALTCKDDCPYTYEFIKTPQVKKTITAAFKHSGISTPLWLFSGNSVTAPVEPSYEKKARVIKVFTCKPHNCDTDNLEGYYKPSNNSFVGVYTEDGYEISVE